MHHWTHFYDPWLANAGILPSKAQNLRPRLWTRSRNKRRNKSKTRLASSILIPCGQRAAISLPVEMALKTVQRAIWEARKQRTKKKAPARVQEERKMGWICSRQVTRTGFRSMHTAEHSLSDRIRKIQAKCSQDHQPLPSLPMSIPYSW
jgi:hypothetical protein